MKKYISKSINVERLLTLGDLDIRKVAAENRTLPADEYFSRVEQFVGRVPQYLEVLKSASDLTELNGMKHALIGIGYDKLTPDMNAVCDAIAAGRRDMAEKWALNISARINALNERLKGAFIKKRFQSEQMLGSAEGQDEVVFLPDALEYFDYEEDNRKLRILAVDDVAVVLGTLTSVLSKHYEVFALTKAAQVESFLQHTSPELFVLDIEMPEMNGYELVHIIRRFDKHKETPIIFLTGNASMENLKTAISLGACDFITKPINPNVLLEKIESKIIRKRAF